MFSELDIEVCHSPSAGSNTGRYLRSAPSNPGALRRRLSLPARVLAAVALALLLFSARAFAPPQAAVPAAFGRGPAIVLVRGFGSDTERWLPTARILARRHRVAFVDLPGHGAREPSEPLSLERATRALDEALARASREPVVLVGHSLGGLVAAAEACAHPGRVRALVLIETALRPQTGGVERRVALAALERDYPGTLRQVYTAFGRDSAQGEALHRQVAGMEPAVVKPWIRLAFTTDLSERVAQLRCPVLVVLAPRSWPKGEPWVETAAVLGFGAVPRVRAVRIADCGHFVMLDRPDELARLIGRFADSPGGEPVVLAPFGG
jgi:pimeloyl-[acyl-carrier protein] methyl ester esterase